MKYIITETKQINITAEIEAPNAAAAMQKYKKDSSQNTVDYSEQSNVEVNAKGEFSARNKFVGAPKEEEQ